MIDWLVLACCLLLAAGHVVLSVRTRFAWWRSLCFAAGLLLFAVVVWAVPGRWPGAHWVGGADVGVATTYVSILVVMGDPVALLRRAGIGARPLAAMMDSRLVNLLAHPLVAGPLNCLLLIGIFQLGWYDQARHGGLDWLLLVLVVAAGGVLTDAGLLVPELLPKVGPGMRLLYSIIDGLLDEIPGLVVMAGYQQVVGGTMWAVVQPVVIPLLLILAGRWVRKDLQNAAEIDAELDALERRHADALLRLTQPGYDEQHGQQGRLFRPSGATAGDQQQAGQGTERG